MKRLNLSLNIRQKISGILAGGMILVTVLSITAFQYLIEIERKVHFVQVVDDLSNIILEARRYEKNFLLYGSPEDLSACRNYTKEGLRMLSIITSDIASFKAAPIVKELYHAMTDYNQIIMGSKIKDRPAASDYEWNTIRDRGKKLVELSNRLVQFERQRIVNLIDFLKKQLIYSVFAIAIASLLGFYLVIKKIVTPLRIIEDTTRRIAMGNFHKIPLTNSRDEIERVVIAFNKMVTELEKRQEQLVESRKLSSLGILASGIAHQLNNPLNNIGTSCQILMEEIDECDPEFARRMLENIDQEVFRARDIVKGLLEFSRSKEFALTPTPIVEPIRRAQKLISSQTPPNVEILIDVPPDIVLDIDLQRMQEVFLNLIMNAIQAMEGEPGQIRISAGISESDQMAIVRVEDTGKGIKKENLEKIFDPFFSTKEVGMGTGLGLSVVYGIIQKHNGSISAKSSPDNGTCFTILLPMKKESMKTHT